MRSKLNYKQFNFTGGKRTESTFFNQPDNSASVLSNFVLQQSGEVSRRLGLDVETSAEYHDDFDVSNLQIASYLWKSVNGEADTEILVVHLGNVLQFYDYTQSPLSGGYLGSVTLTTYRLDSESVPLEFASGEGVLFVVGRNLEPVYVSYIDSLFSVTRIEIKVRDLDGVEDGLSNEARPSTLSNLHEYNLRNQGWPLSFEVSTEIRNPNTIEGDAISLNDPVAYTKTKLGVYPSNADSIHVAKRQFPNGMFPYEPFKLEELQLGNTRAARGKFILNAFSKNRSAARAGQTSDGVSAPSGNFQTITIPAGIAGEFTYTIDLSAFVDTDVTLPDGSIFTLTQEFLNELFTEGGGLTTETVSTRPTAVAFYSGRVFYAGKEAGSKSTRLFFSQFLRNISNAGKCYQEQDPTAEQLNGVLATDGGVIPLPDAGEVLKLVPFRTGVMIIAENGIWFIAGSPDTGFTATDHSLQKIAEETALSGSSVVTAGDRVLFWGEHGIYAVELQEQGELRAVNIAQQTIQSDYNLISGEAKRYAKGFHDPERNEILWCYSSDTDRDSKHFNDKILFLNINLSAFYEYTLPEGPNWLIQPVEKSNTVRGTTTIPVVDSTGTVVTDSGGADVTTSITTFTGTASTLKYLSLHPSGSLWTPSFSEFSSGTFLDWTTEDYTSELQTAWFVLEDGAREKQIHWLLVHFRRTESGYGASDFLTPSAALLRTKFEFTGSASGNRWSDQSQVYRLKEIYLDGDTFDYGYDVVTHKKRVRGHGRGVAIQLESESGKDLKVLGWDIEFSGRSRV